MSLTGRKESNQIHIEAFRAVYTYVCLTSRIGCDSWGDKQFSVARRMLKEMGFPWEGNDSDLKTKFINLRKSTNPNVKFVPVINPNMARKGGKT
jgi:hypothetical protein